jgi:tetratricopeptide (TPR) repeat protein
MMWSCGLQAFKESPLLGKGWGGFELNFALCQGGLIKDYPNLALLITRANGAHNIFIETLAQSGAVGFLFFILFFISFFAAALANTRKACGEDKLFPLALLACAVAMLVDNLLNITVQTNITAFVFWWLVSSLLWRGARNFEIKIPVAAGAALFASVFIGAVFLVVRQKNYLLALNMEHRAGKYYAARNYGQASSLSAKSLKRFKYNPYAWELLLNSLFKRAEYGKALEASRQAVKYYPDYYEFLFKKGALEAALGEAPSAARDLQAALALNPAKASDSELKKISLFAQNQIPLYNKP